ncbi:MAG: HD domain-containing phosphohydrolase [Spirochaetota bacterium]|jgi:HD-GYP domain-containing protein (c-di-GMP phosphodiesterase class II)
MNKDASRLRDIIRIGSDLNDIQDLDILLERILSEARKVVNADAGSIYIRDGEHLVFSHSQNDTLQKKLPEGQKLIYTTFRLPINRKSLSGYVASTGEILNTPDVYNIPAEASYRFDSTYDKLSQYRTTSVLTVPLKTSRDDIVGVLQIINAMDDSGGFIPFDSALEPYVLHFAGIASMVLQRAQMTRTLLLRMISMAELRDPKETGAHVNRVASYSVELYERWAQRRGVPRATIDRNRDILRMAAMLHDVGKVAISDLILKKPAKFTDDEYEIMKRHTYLGARLFRERQSEFDEVAAIVALTHHENWDGTGYPGRVDGNTCEPIDAHGEEKPEPLKGEEIPIYGRIVALADVYDALSSRRVYKEAWEEDSVLEEIKKLSGRKFDPELIDVFFENLDFIRSIRQRYPEAD